MLNYHHRDVKVPVENLIGKENKGFPIIMSNCEALSFFKSFSLLKKNAVNPERIGIAMQANRLARVCLEECMRYASKRKTFGTTLREHPVIRAKLANMGHRVEATHAWLESLVHQASEFDADDLTLRLGGQSGPRFMALFFCLN